MSNPDAHLSCSETSKCAVGPEQTESPRFDGGMSERKAHASFNHCSCAGRHHGHEHDRAALAGNGKDHGTYAFGKGVSVHCDASYGQLVKAAKQSGHVTGPVSGVKSFVESGLFAAHCL
jgi:hypothetical protein